jgi:cytochrome P450
MTAADPASASRPMLGDPEFFAGEPDAALGLLRRTCPVSWHDGARVWALARHADVQAVSSDPARFRSGQGVLLADRNRAVAAADSVLYLDPPRHARYRTLVSRGFTPRRVAGLEPRVRALACELLDRVDPGRPVEVVDALTAPLPLLVIAELLGLPASDREDFRRWSDAVMAAATEITEENALVAMELLVYFDAQLTEREASPRDDLLTALLAAEVDGQRLTRQELLGFCMTLLVAGNETTRNLLTGGLLALAEWPEQRDRLVADRSLIGGAVEEMLRWTAPIMAMCRTATADTAIAGTPVAAGDYVAMLYASANRDEEVFTDPDRFDVGRSPNPHLSFGVGEHYCLGAGLARLEARVFFEEVLERWPGYELAGTPVRVPSTLLRQISSLPIRFAPEGP